LVNNDASDGNLTIITYFLGTTPQTCSISQTFRLIIRQLDLLFKLSFFEKSDNLAGLKSSELRAILVSQLTEINKNYSHKKIVIILDSIDQLLDSNDLDKIDWLMKQAPANTKIIFSVLSHPNYAGLMTKLRKHLDDEQNFLEIKQLNLNASLEMLKQSLFNCNRKLNESQLDVVSRVFQAAFDSQSLNPLLVKIVFNITKKWASGTEPSGEFAQLKNLDDCIKYLFTTLENKYGKLLISRIMFYMSIFKNGCISESELEDILSLDDQVLFTIFEYKISPIQRFPIGLWARIKYDLEEYLAFKQVDDTQVLSWYCFLEFFFRIIVFFF
jgi:hypothetical protein